MKKHQRVGSHPHVVLCPGIDGDGNRVSPKELAELYGVPFADCLVWDPSGTWTARTSWRPWPWDVQLYPARKGEGYVLPEEAKSILAKHYGVVL